MITVWLGVSQVCDPFIMFTGKKKSKSIRPRSTLDFDFKFVIILQSIIFACVFIYHIWWLMLIEDIKIGKKEVPDGYQQWHSNINIGLMWHHPLIEMVEKSISRGKSWFDSRPCSYTSNVSVTGKLNIKLPRDEMITLIENSVKRINTNELTKPTIKNTFQRVGQDPHVNCTELFKNHLDCISTGSMYRTILNVQQPMNLE